MVIRIATTSSAALVLWALLCVGAAAEPFALGRASARLEVGGAAAADDSAGESPRRRLVPEFPTGPLATLRLEKLWDRNVTITTRLVDTAATAMLLNAVTSGRLRPQPLITHRFRLSDMMAAYDVFSHAARERAMKVILSAEG